MVYVINRDNSLPANNEQVVKLTKVMNYEKCSKRPEFSQSNYYGQQCQECQQVRETGIYCEFGHTENQSMGKGPLTFQAQDSDVKGSCTQNMFYSPNMFVRKGKQVKFGNDSGVVALPSVV